MMLMRVRYLTPSQNGGDMLAIYYGTEDNMRLATDIFGAAKIEPVINEAMVKKFVAYLDMSEITLMKQT